LQLLSSENKNRKKSLSYQLHNSLNLSRDEIKKETFQRKLAKNFACNKHYKE